MAGTKIITMDTVDSPAPAASSLFQDNLSFLQKVFDQTDKRFVKTIGISFGQLRGMKTGRTEPNIASLLKISDVTKLPVDFILKIKLEEVFSEKDILRNTVTDRYNTNSLVNAGAKTPDADA